MVPSWVYLYFAGRFELQMAISGVDVFSQHLGGIHSGCAISGVAWIVLMVVHQFKQKYLFNDSILAFGVITTVMLFVTICAGLPWVRNTHHK